ncbi:MAG: hypothetical protein DLM68_07020 [Hyphomicrobiales bacterium]|nr:MAG: hypothetical protein DLM68_07020 [Hyphomicrobiales bacterium]
MAAILEIPALNPISPYFPGGIGNIRRFAVRAFCSEAEPVSHQENAMEQTLNTNIRGTTHGVRAFSHAKRLLWQILGLS